MNEDKMTRIVIIGVFNGLITLAADFAILYFFFGYFNWIALGLSLIVPFFVMAFYFRYSPVNKKLLILFSLTSGLTFIIVGWLGIWLFPPTIIRDLWDIIQPYFNILFESIVLMGVTYGYGNYLLVTSHKSRS